VSPSLASSFPLACIATAFWAVGKVS